MDDIEERRAVADDNEEQTADRYTKKLDVYQGTNHPGQHWAAYRSRALKEPDAWKDLRRRLKDLLTPSTTDVELLKKNFARGVALLPISALQAKADGQARMARGGSRTQWRPLFLVRVYT